MFSCLRNDSAKICIVPLEPPRRKWTCGRFRPFRPMQTNARGHFRTLKCIAPLEMPLGEAQEAAQPRSRRRRCGDGALEQHDPLSGVERCLPVGDWLLSHRKVPMSLMSTFSYLSPPYIQKCHLGGLYARYFTCYHLMGVHISEEKKGSSG
jgi:hypothetical protein